MTTPLDNFVMDQDLQGLGVLCVDVVKLSLPFLLLLSFSVICSTLSMDRNINFKILVKMQILIQLNGKWAEIVMGRVCHTPSLYRQKCPRTPWLCSNFPVCLLSLGYLEIAVNTFCKQSKDLWNVKLSIKPEMFKIIHETMHLLI